MNKNISSFSPRSISVSLIGILIGTSFAPSLVLADYLDKGITTTTLSSISILPVEQPTVVQPKFLLGKSVDNGVTQSSKSEISAIAPMGIISWIVMVLNALKAVTPARVTHILQAKHDWIKVVSRPVSWGKVSDVTSKVLNSNARQVPDKNLSLRFNFSKTSQIGKNMVEVQYRLEKGVMTIVNAFVLK